MITTAPAPMATRAARPASASAAEWARSVFFSQFAGIGTIPAWAYQPRGIHDQHRQNVNLKDAAGLQRERLTPPQPLQNRDCRKAVRHKPAAGLEIPYRGARLGTEPSARLTDVEAMPR